MVSCDDISRLELFELAYHAASNVPFRCFSIKINPGEDHKGNVALLYNSASKQFISIFTNESGVKVDLFEETEDSLDDHLGEIQANLEKFKSQLLEKSEDARDQITKCILVERKTNEACHLALAKDVARKVYFAIGECRERAALIPMFQNSQGGGSCPIHFA